MKTTSNNKPVYLEDKVDELLQEVESLRWEVGDITNKIEDLTYLLNELLHQTKGK